MEKKAIVCDCCGEQLAKNKCIFCGKDCCKRCSWDMDLWDDGDNQYRWKVDISHKEKGEICTECTRKINKFLSGSKTTNPRTSLVVDNLKEFFKKNLPMEEL